MTKKTTSPVKFGTDGWRGIIADDFTFDNVRACAQATADHFTAAGLAGRGMVIGYDRRFASEDFAAATAGVLAGNGIKVYLSPRPVATPVVSYANTVLNAAGAVIITASHNAAAWNGFKIKAADGSSAGAEVTDDVEKRVAAILANDSVKRLPLVEAESKGLLTRTDLDIPYKEQIARLVDLDALRRAPFKVIIDPMYGVGAGYARDLLAGGAIEIREINAERNPAFPGIGHPEPIAENLDKLLETIAGEGAQVGIATDGDADRVGIVDERGNFLTQLQTCALLALYLLEIRGERGALIKTITMTDMLYRLGELYDVPVYETSVGFKYVAPLMIEHNALIGGEESGGYGFRGHIPERDGILAGLLFLDFMLKTGKTPSELLAYLYDKVGPHYYHRIDYTFPEKERQNIIARVRDNPPAAIDGDTVLKLDTADGFRFRLQSGAWLLIRFSGTEPILRIYAETDNPERVNRLLEAGKKLTGLA